MEFHHLHNFIENMIFKAHKTLKVIYSQQQVDLLNRFEVRVLGKLFQKLNVHLLYPLQN